jgi:hypothetical protein
MSKKGQPRLPCTAGMGGNACPVLVEKSFLMLIPNDSVSCIAVRVHPEYGLRCFISTIVRTSSGDGPLGPGFVLGADEYSSRYFRFLRMSCNLKSVDERMRTAVRWMWRRPRNNDQDRSWNRLNGEKRGARRRERLTTRRCYFMRRLCATMVLAPPGPKSLAIVESRCARSSSGSFMLKKGSDVGVSN